MWQNQPDVTNLERHLSRLREEDAKNKNGEQKTPEEYLAEIED